MREEGTETVVVYGLRMLARRRYMNSATTNLLIQLL